MRKTLTAFLTIPFILSACSHNNVTIDDSLKNYFDQAGVSGSFALFDNLQGHFTIYNLPRYRDSAYLPAATFDLLTSLIGIQTGIVKDDNAVIQRGDDSALIPAGRGSAAGHSSFAGVDCPLSVTLHAAFRHSCTNAFDELAARIGKDTIKKWIDSLGYGNRDIGASLDSFRQNGRLKITADEELGLVKKLYFDQLPFFQRTQRIVRNMMLMEDNANYKLSYKTGWGVGKDGQSIGWVVGWVEENKHPNFFVLNLESADATVDMDKTGLNILRSILKQMGFFEGKK